MRDKLYGMLTECVSLAREMLDEDIWGYNDMKDNYADELYLAIKKVRDMV